MAVKISAVLNSPLCTILIDVPCESMQQSFYVALVTNDLQFVFLSL